MVGVAGWGALGPRFNPNSFQMFFSRISGGWQKNFPSISVQISKLIVIYRVSVHLTKIIWNPTVYYSQTHQGNDKYERLRMVSTTPEITCK